MGYIKIEYPCGYKITLFSLLQGLEVPSKCPIHGKDCEGLIGVKK